MPGNKRETVEALFEYCLRIIQRIVTTSRRESQRAKSKRNIMADGGMGRSAMNGGTIIAGDLSENMSSKLMPANNMKIWRKYRKVTAIVSAAYGGMLSGHESQ